MKKIILFFLVVNIVIYASDDVFKLRESAVKDANKTAKNAEQLYVEIEKKSDEREHLSNEIEKRIIDNEAKRKLARINLDSEIPN